MNARSMKMEKKEEKKKGGKLKEEEEEEEIKICWNLLVCLVRSTPSPSINAG